MRLGESCPYYLCMKYSPEFTNIMTERPLEHQANFTSLRDESVRDYTSHHVQLSDRDTQVLDRLLVLLPVHLKSQPTSRISPFSPALLFSICDILQHSRTDTLAEQDDTSVLPSVLSKLRDWRLLDPVYRYRSECIRKLALDLAGIIGEASAPTGSDGSRTSQGRLRMKWLSSDSSIKSRDRGLFSSPTSSSASFGVLDSPQERAHVPPDVNQCLPDDEYRSCQPGVLGTPDSEDASAIVSQQHHFVSGFRSGCSACRHPRVSGPSIPPSPQMSSLGQFGDVKQLDTNVNASFPSHRHQPTVRQPFTNKTKSENQKSLRSIPRATHVDENEPPLPKSPGIQQGIGISFPRQCMRSPRISNTLLSREPFSPVATSVQRRMRPDNTPNRTREGDKHRFTQSATSVGSFFPVDHSHTSVRASSIDLLSPTPNRAQSFSHTPVNSRGLGKVTSGASKLTSNAAGRSSRRLPSSSQTHRHDPVTTTSAILNPTGALPPPPAKAHSQNTYSAAPLRPRMLSSALRDVKSRDCCFALSQTHKHPQSAGSLPSPLITARKWQV